MLPAIWAANQSTSAPAPPVVLLDFHSELSPWDENSLGHQKLLTATSCDDVLDCCEMQRRPKSNKTIHDGNWLDAALKLKWVGPVVTIGLESPDDPRKTP